MSGALRPGLAGRVCQFQYVATPIYKKEWKD
jgi:hypothetical protein